jgi:hypothetical protein
MNPVVLQRDRNAIVDEASSADKKLIRIVKTPWQKPDLLTVL